MIIHPKNLIINRKDKQTTRQRALGIALMITLWGLILYLLRPVLIIAGWAISYYIFKSVAFDIQAHAFFRIAVLTYLPVVLILSLALWGWAAYNLLRFRGSRDKRTVPPQPVSPADIAASSFLPLEALATIRGSRRVTCHFNENGQINQVVCLAGEEPAAPAAGPGPLFNPEPFGGLAPEKSLA